MRIIDCSSDVCSSDLLDGPFVRHHEPGHQPDERGLPRTVRPDETGDPAGGNGGADRVERRRIPAVPLGYAVETNQDAAAHVPPPPGRAQEIGRASCGERVCQYVMTTAVPVPVKKKN